VAGSVNSQQRALAAVRVRADNSKGSYRRLKGISARGQLPSSVLEKTRVRNDWSRGAADVGRQRSGREEISKADLADLGRVSK
jgi:hypothetical protein